MEALITSYLIQKKECNLPLLGHFRIKTKPAEFDRTNKEIFPPADEILYSEFASKIPGDLVSYVSVLENISNYDAEEKIKSWCNSAKAKIDSGQKITFNSIGSLQKDAAGNIFFQRKKHVTFYEPVTAERVHRNDSHSVLVGENETTSAVMNEFYRDETAPGTSAWKIWAIVLFALSLLVLVFYFYTHEFSETGIGNHGSFSTQSPPPSYHSP
jgi:nucleoid DNA-binding protein